MISRPPVWFTRITAPGAHSVAMLCGLDALARAVVVAALPLQTHRLIGGNDGVSALFLAGSVAALAMALVMPRLAAQFGRRRLGTVGILLLVAAAGFFMAGLIPTQVMGFVLRSVGTAVVFAVVSMAIMDHVRRDQLGRSEPIRMLFIGLGWTCGPIAGVWLDAVAGPAAPFVASGAIAMCMLIYYRALGFSDGIALRSTDGVQPAPAAFGRNLKVFLAQPRLVLALAHAVGRGVSWASFNIYTPLFAVQIGLGAAVGGLLMGVGSGCMLAMPLWGWLARRHGIRRVSLVCFPVTIIGTAGAGLLTASPWVAAGFLLLGVLAMAVVDGYGNTLFLRACKPAQRTAMAPIFATQRDISQIAVTATFAVLLGLFPIQAVYLTLAVVMCAMTGLAMKIHPRL